MGRPALPPPRPLVAPHTPGWRGVDPAGAAGGLGARAPPLLAGPRTAPQVRVR